MGNQSTITTGNMYKSLFLRLKNLILIPGKEWKSIHRENRSINEILAEFSLPLIALCTLATFINYTINRQGIDFELALRHSIIVFTALFGGLYICFLLFKVLLPIFAIPKSNQLIFRITAYSSGLWYMTTFFTNLFPELLFLHLAIFYSFYIVWQAIKDIAGVKEDQKMIITLLVSVLIHIIPFFVLYLLRFAVIQNILQ